MHRLIAVVLVAAFGALAPSALGQAEAQQAYLDGKKAYEVGDFVKARDLFARASQTDGRNAEVFLWLGKAHYQLGQVDEALAAWRRVRQLAPDEPQAKRMVEALTGALDDVATRLKLVEELLRQELFDPAEAACRRLLDEKALTDAQRAEAMLARAEAQAGLGKWADVQTAVLELRARFAKQVDPAAADLLLARAKLAAPATQADGLAILKRIVAERAASPAAPEARYELIRYALGQAPTEAGAKDLAKWIADNAAHRAVPKARQLLVNVYLSLEDKAAAPQADDKLGSLAAGAIDEVKKLLADTVRLERALSLARQVIEHLDKRYAANGAYAAAAAGAEALLAAKLPAAVAAEVLRAQAGYRCVHVLKALTDQARAGRLGAQMPPALAEVVALYTALGKAHPQQAAMLELARLAGAVEGLGRHIPWPAQVTALKPTQAWAGQIALPVVRAHADAAALAEAVKVVEKVIGELSGLKKREAGQLALTLNTQLLEALRAEDAAWPQVIKRQIGLMDAEAREVFAENVKAGQDAKNAGLTEGQKRMIGAMVTLVARDAAQGAWVLAAVSSHLRPWVGRRHFAAAREAYEMLAAGQGQVRLPAAQVRQARLAVGGLWSDEAAAGHDRLLTAGLAVPRKLDPNHRRALERLYSLQADLDEGDAFLAQARAAWDAVVKHYAALEYYDVAEEAIGARPAAAVEAANAYAQLALANLHYGQARRELGELLRRYRAADRLQLTDKFKVAIADYEKVISTWPAGGLVGQAVSGVFSIAQTFEAHAAYDVAVGVYRNFAAFAAKVGVLSQAPPGAASTAERAEFAAAGALLSKAREALKKALAASKTPAEPPAKISPEFTAAVGAFRAFIKAHPSSALVGEAIGQVLSVATEYVRVGSWDVADGIYTDLLASDLALHRPERVRLRRGLCQLGKVMPAHARQVLTALGAGDRGGPVSGLARAGEEEEKDSGRGRRRPPSPTVRPPRPEPKPVPPGGADLNHVDNYKTELNKNDMLAMAAIRRQQDSRAGRIAMLRDEVAQRRGQVQGKAQGAQQSRSAQQAELVAALPVLSEAELARRERAFDAAYGIFQSIRKDYPTTPTAQQARGEVLVMVGHWREIAQWQRAAALAERYLKDNPADAELPGLRLAVARDYLAWAAKPPEQPAPKQAMLAQVAERFDAARAQLAGIVNAFPDEKAVIHDAQWDIARSYLTQARVVDAFSPTLARGQFVRAARELLALADRFHDHPRIGTIPQMLWDIAGELAGKGYWDEAITVWNQLAIHHPAHALAHQAAMRIAQTYRDNLGRPLRAAEAYLEINFARGGADVGVQNLIYQIGVDLRNKKRWVEALHVLETFVASFPAHAQAGQALAMTGQIHQANEVWEDAIRAYRRVLAEYPSGGWVQQAKWAIAECTLNLSRWREAMAAYRSYVQQYPKDGNVAEANRRIGILKDLARYQVLVDEKGQRKAFEAQYQIAEIVRTQLANPVKAIVEYRKVTKNWPQTHRADDALFLIGTTYLSTGEIDKAREALEATAGQYPNSPLADDALFMVGKSFEEAASKLAEATRPGARMEAEQFAQKRAYQRAQDSRRRMEQDNDARIAQLKKGGKEQMADLEMARFAAQGASYNLANVSLEAQRASQEVETLTAAQLADRQDKISALQRKAVDAFGRASRVASADKAGEALQQMASIFDEKLKEPDEAMKTWLEIVRQFSGTQVAEEATWRIADTYERKGDWANAIDSYKAFLRNYRGSKRAADAQFAIAEAYEHLGQWVQAMDAYTNYVTNFPDGKMAGKAKEQINWIKTYRL